MQKEQTVSVSGSEGWWYHQFEGRDSYKGIVGVLDGRGGEI